jgi:hypothetical protein
LNDFIRSPRGWSLRQVPDTPPGWNITAIVG